MALPYVRMYYEKTSRGKIGPAHVVISLGLGSDTATHHPRHSMNYNRFLTHTGVFRCSK